MGREKLFDIPVQLLVDLEKAWRLSDGTRDEWFPKSQCELEKNSDGTYTLTGPEWLLKEKGFI